MTTTPPNGHRRRAHLRRVVLITLTLLAALLTGAPLTAPVAHAADNGTWAVYPTPAAGAAPGSRTYFTLDSRPGAIIKDRVTIANLSDRPMTFRVYGADAYNTPRDGGFALRGVDERQTDVGSWTKLTTGRVTVRAHSHTDLPFTLTIPAKATPGDHSGALVALDAAVEGTQKQGGLTVGIQRAVGARIYLHVKGPVRPGLAVEDLRIDRHTPTVPFTGSSSATIHYSLVNRGNTRLQPRFELTATDLFGRTTLHIPSRNLALTLMPGQHVELTEPWPDAPQFGRHSLTLHVTTAGGSAQDTAHATLTIIPWLTVTLLLVLAAAAITLRRVRRRPRIHPETA
ncbi:WxL protein peptidoglycan domain-containing protein [Streptomyces sp. NPDC020801]|uniref:WxL protein peptidoglycan domain-containing protein n=1 Tax=unclassified Streptomyces TaxID=2593676 RepID=UPI0037A3E27F